MMLFVPPPLNSKETFTISIESMQFNITYGYNDREDSWYFTLTKDGLNVLNSIKLTWGYNFGYNYVNFPLVLGNLILYSPNNDTTDPNKNNFGKTVFIAYESKS